MKGVLKALLALIIIAGGAGIGYVLANNTDLGKAGSASPTPTVAVAAAAAAATPIPTFTPAFAGSPAALPGNGGGGRNANGGTQGANGNGGRNANATPGATNTTPGATGQGQGRGGNNVAGTIMSYDATSKTLVITAQNGNKLNVLTTNATLTKADKFSLDDISKVNGAVLVVQGTKGDDGTYQARSINLVDPSAAGGAGGGRGFGGGGTFAGGGQGGQGQAQGGFVILNTPAVSGNTITGKSFQGEDVKVAVTNTTTMTKQGPATAEDLTEGKRVTVVGQAQTNGDIEATVVSITG